MRFTMPDSQVATIASVISKPAQSLVALKTGIQIGPGRPVRVRIIR